MAIPIPCPQCGKFPPPDCGCPPLPDRPVPAPEATPAAAPAPKLRAEVIKLRREKRGGGREVTILEGFFTGSADVERLGRDLKRRCGTGGSVKGGVIELQGDHRDEAAAFLLERGFRSKRAGG